MKEKHKIQLVSKPASVRIKCNLIDAIFVNKMWHDDNLRAKKKKLNQSVNAVFVSIENQQFVFLTWDTFHSVRRYTISIQLSSSVFCCVIPLIFNFHVFFFTPLGSLFITAIPVIVVRYINRSVPHKSVYVLIYLDTWQTRVILMCQSIFSNSHHFQNLSFPGALHIAERAWHQWTSIIEQWIGRNYRKFRVWFFLFHYI